MLFDVAFKMLQLEGRIVVIGAHTPRQSYRSQSHAGPHLATSSSLVVLFFIFTFDFSFAIATEFFELTVNPIFAL